MPLTDSGGWALSVTRQAVFGHQETVASRIERPESGVYLPDPCVDGAGISEISKALAIARSAGL